MIDKLPAEVREIIFHFWHLLGLVPAALFARLVEHSHTTREQQRPFWSVELLWALPTAVLCALFAAGLAEYFDLDLWATHAMAGGLGYIGPRTVKTTIVGVVERYKPAGR